MPITHTTGTPTRHQRSTRFIAGRRMRCDEDERNRPASAKILRSKMSRKKAGIAFIWSACRAGAALAMAPLPFQASSSPGSATDTGSGAAGMA